MKIIMTPLGYVGLITTLLGSTASAALPKLKTTPLMDAAYYCRPNQVFALLKKGANVRARDNQGNDVSYWARLRGCDEAVGLIQRAGTPALDAWHRVEEDAEIALKKSRLGVTLDPDESVKGLPSFMTKRAAIAEKEIGLPAGQTPDITTWHFRSVHSREIWVARYWLDTSGGSESTFYRCGFTLLGDVHHEFLLTTATKCGPLKVGADGGHDSSPLAVVHIKHGGDGVIFKWYGPYENGRWLFVKGAFGWQRVANTTDMGE